LDELIKKLKELTKPEPKYKVGDTVWMLTGDELEIQSMVIGQIDENNQDGIWYADGEAECEFKQCGWLEEQLYPTKQALIYSQIEHWQNMLFPEIPECEHEEYIALSGKPMCRKCGVEYPHTADKCVHEPCTSMPTLNDGGRVNKCKHCGEFYR